MTTIDKLTCAYLMHMYTLLPNFIVNNYAISTGGGGGVNPTVPPNTNMISISKNATYTYTNMDTSINTDTSSDMSDDNL